MVDVTIMYVWGPTRQVCIAILRAKRLQSFLHTQIRANLLSEPRETPARQTLGGRYGPQFGHILGVEAPYQSP